MSCNVNHFIDCPALQTTLNGNFLKLAPNYREMNVFLGFLVSPANTDNTLQKQIDVGNGHIRTVEVRYQPRLTEDQVSDSAVQNCDGGQKPGETSAQYTIDTTAGVSHSWTIEFQDLINRCEDDEAWFARQIQNGIDVICRKLDTKCIQQAALLRGDFPDGGNSDSIHVATKNSSGIYVPDAIEKIPFEFMQMDYMGSVALFSGSEKFYNYFNSQAGMCCNSTFGVDLPSLFRSKNLVPMFDRKVETLVGTDEIIAMAPGALQLLTYLQFRGMQAISTDVYKQGTVMDPFSGLMFDYLAKFDCGSWNFQLKLSAEVVAMPQDMFCADDRMHGVTWVNGFKIVNP